MQRAVSNVGREAVFGTPDEEIDRILRNKANFYIVLKVLKDSSPEEIRVNHRRLSLLVHPDKNPNRPSAADASAVVNQAKTTLTDPLKKRLYDAYVQDVAVNAEEGEPMTYAEWEASAAKVQLPAWLEKILRIPVLGNIVMLLIALLILGLLLLVVPIMFVLILLSLLITILCLPINACIRCISGGAPESEQPMEHDQFAAAAGGEAAADNTRPGVTASQV